MCFSATASFATGGVLSAAGIASVSKATKKELPLALMPFLFGIHQVIDGVVWVTADASRLHIVAVYAYSTVAFVFWPIFTPIALLLIETHSLRKRILKAFLIVGLCVSSFYLYFIASAGVTARLLRYCVVYSTPHPHAMQALAFYLLVVCGSFFTSSKRILNLFGAVLLGSFAIAGWFYVEAFSSTWCFFAAVLSVILFWYFHTKRI